MQGDQSIELTDQESALSEAMGEHFKSENCNGVLIHNGSFGVLDLDSKCVHNNIYQFVCGKCCRVFQIEGYEKTKS